MKSKLMKLTLLALVLFVFVVTVSGQGVAPHLDPKFGPDSISRMECAKNISLYSEFYKQQNYVDAVKPWRYVFNSCPEASKNTYIKGATIYKNLIEREKDAVKKSALVDTLMMVYDKRIAYYPADKGSVLSYKGSDLFTYRKEAANKEVYEILGEALKLEGKESKGGAISIYMQTAVGLFKAKELDGEKVIEAYTFAIETIDLAVAYNNELVAQAGKQVESAKKELEALKVSNDNVEALFSESGAANCDALVAIFAPKYEANAQNLAWLSKVNKVMSKSECTKQELYAKTAEQQYKLEPSAEAAYNLARLFLKKEQFEKAAGYYDEAVKLATDPAKKVIYLTEWSQVALVIENYAQVRTLSNSIIELNATDGKPYIMIGKAYAASKKLNIGKEEIEHSAVYWAAVDSFLKAKKVDPALAAEVDELVATYSKYFPKYEEWFMAVGTKEGDSYTIGGWINVSTRVRF